MAFQYRTSPHKLHVHHAHGRNRKIDLCAQNSVCDSFMHAVMQMDIAQSRYMRGIHINQLILLKITQLIVLMSSVIFERLTVRTGGCGCKIEQLCEVS